MGHKFAKYENVLAAELVTRFGRFTIQECAKIAKKFMKWEIIYGDTDSLFINNGEAYYLRTFKYSSDACRKQLTCEYGA